MMPELPHRRIRSACAMTRSGRTRRLPALGSFAFALGLGTPAAELSIAEQLATFEADYRQERERLLAECRAELLVFQTEQLTKLQAIIDDPTFRDDHVSDMRCESTISGMRSTGLVVEVTAGQRQELVTYWGVAIPSNRLTRSVLKSGAQLDSVGRVYLLALLEAELVRKPADAQAYSALSTYLLQARESIAKFYTGLDDAAMREAAIAAAIAAFRTASGGNPDLAPISEAFITAVEEIDPTDAMHDDNWQLLQTIIDHVQVGGARGKRP